MQSQEGMFMPPERTAPAEQSINTDPREQQQRQEPSIETQLYEERTYEDGYAGLDADDLWRQEGEKLRPKATSQYNFGGFLWLLVLLCALLIAATFIGVLITWLSWLLLTLLITGGIFFIILNWRTVDIPLPVETIAISAAHPRLIINETMGTVSIRRGEDGVVSVAPIKHLSGIGAIPQNMHVGYDLRDNLLRVSTQIKWNEFHFGLRRIDLEITVPENCDVQVNNGSGRIYADGLSGTIQLRTGSGKIEVGSLRGNIALKTGSGSVTGQEVNGQLELKTGSGSITLQQTVLAGTSRLRTGSGSISFDGALDPRGSYEMKTGSGSIDLALLPDASFQLKASTGSGRIINEFADITIANKSKAPLKLRTGSGSIRVHKTYLR